TFGFARFANGTGEDGGRTPQVHRDDSRVDSGTDRGSRTARPGIARSAPGCLRRRLLPRAPAPGAPPRRTQQAGRRRVDGGASAQIISDQITEATLALLDGRNPWPWGCPRRYAWC